MSVDAGTSLSFAATSLDDRSSADRPSSAGTIASGVVVELTDSGGSGSRISAGEEGTDIADAADAGSAEDGHELALGDAHRADVKFVQRAAVGGDVCRDKFFLS